MDSRDEQTFGATRLFFPPHGGGGAGFASPHVDREKVTEEAIIRELLQNALDAAAGDGSVQVIFRQERVPTANLPCIDEYERAFGEARTYRQVYGSESPAERQAIDRISSCLKAPTVSVLVCTDRGAGIGEKDLRSLYNTGDTTKRTGRGSVGLGHLTAFAASDLRYVLYVGRQESGQVTFGGHAILATSRGGDGSGPQQDAHGYIRGAEEVADTPASEASGASVAPTLVDGWLPEGGSAGSAVAILGYGSDERGDIGDNILSAAAKNFVVAVHLDSLTVTVRTEKGRELVLGSGNLGDVLASKREQQRLRRRLGVRGREAWSAYETLTSGTPLEVDNLPGVSIWFRELPVGERTLVCFFREGMWITSDANHLKNSDFDDRAPFAAVVNVDEPEGEGTESVCSLVREAEGETHSQIRPTEITDPGMKHRLDKALIGIRDLLRDHAPKLRAKNIEPEQLRFFHGKTLTVVPRPPRRDTISKDAEEDVLEVVSDGADGAGRGGDGSGGGGGDGQGNRRAPRKIATRGNPAGIRATSRHLGGRRWAVAWATERFHSGAAGVRVVVPSGADETTDRYVSDEHMTIAALHMNGQTVTPHDSHGVEVLLLEPPENGEAEIELAEDPHELDIAVLRVEVIHRGKSVSGARA